MTDEHLVGFTLRIPTRGILELDTALSISYSPHDNTSTHAVIWGCTAEQRASLLTQLHPCSSLTRHPLVLPILLAEMHRDVIADQTLNQWERLLNIETKSGLTGAPLLGTRPHAGMYLSEENLNGVTTGMLGVVQIATAAQRHARSLLAIVEAMERAVGEVNGLAVATAAAVAASEPSSNSSSGTRMKTMTEIAGSILLEKLSLIKLQTQTLLADLEATQERGKVQITAVSEKHLPSVPVTLPSPVALVLRLLLPPLSILLTLTDLLHRSTTSSPRTMRATRSAWPRVQARLREHRNAIARP